MKKSIFRLGTVLAIILATTAGTLAILATGVSPTLSKTNTVAQPISAQRANDFGGPIGDFVLSTTLPSGPQRAVVYEAKAPANYNNEEMRALAQQLQLKPELYRPHWPGDVDTPQAYIPSAAFGGPREMNVVNGVVFYQDSTGQGIFGPSFGPSSTTTKLLPFAQASKIAEDYLKSQGFLNFNYKIEAPLEFASPYQRDTVVQFTPIIANKYALLTRSSPGVLAFVDVDGRVRSFFAGRQPQLTEGRSEPLLTAQEAWQRIISGTGQISVYGIDTSAITNPASQIEFPRVWQPDPKPGQRLDWIGLPTVYTPIEWQGKAILRIGNLTLSSYPADLLAVLQKLQAPDIAPFHIWGQLNFDSAGALRFDIEGWRALDQKSVASFFGITVVNTDNKGVRTVTLERVPIPGLPEGAQPPNANQPQRVILKNAPADLPNGVFAEVLGVLLPEKQNDFPLMLWMFIVEVKPSLLATPSPIPTVVAGAPPPAPLIPITNVKGFEPVAAISVTAVTLPTPRPSPTPFAPQPGTPAPTAAPQPPLVPVPPASPYKPGDRVEALEGRVQVQIIESYDGKTRRTQAIFAPEADLPALSDPYSFGPVPYTLLGHNGADVPGIEKMDQLRVRVWGRYKEYIPDPNNPKPQYSPPYQIEVERIELVTPNASVDWWIGSVMTTTLDGRTLGVLQTRAGDRFVMRSSIMFSPPSGLFGQYDPWKGYTYNGTQGLIEGVLTDKAVGGMRVLEDIRRTYSPDIQTATKPEDLARVRVTMRPDIIREPKPSTLFVTQVDLVYRADNIKDQVARNKNQDAKVRMQALQPAALFATYAQAPVADGRLIPAWRFRGKSDYGLLVEVLVDAVK